MTVKELVAALNTIEDQTRTVEVAVRTYTTRYVQAYVTPFEVERGSARIYISLPQGQSISTREVKP